MVLEFASTATKLALSLAGTVMMSRSCVCVASCVASGCWLLAYGSPYSSSCSSAPSRSLCVIGNSCSRLGVAAAGCARVVFAFFDFLLAFFGFVALRFLVA